MTDSIPIIEGDLTLRRELTSVLGKASFDVAGVADYQEALLKLEEFKPDLAIVAEVLPVRDGWYACARLHGDFGIPVILMGRGSSKALKRAVEAGADFYLKEPFNHLELVTRVKAILRRYKKDEAG